MVTIEDTSLKLVFKSTNFQHKFSSKKKNWRTLRQIIVLEKTLPWPENYVHYSSINAPPSFKPAKKYSDISGLLAKYTDPQTKLYYSNSDEYKTICILSNDIVQGYLSLRGASNTFG